MSNLQNVYRSLLVELRNNIDKQIETIDGLDSNNPKVTISCLKHYYLNRELLAKHEEMAIEFYQDLNRDRLELDKEIELLIEESKKNKDMVKKICPILLLYLIQDSISKETGST